MTEDRLNALAVL
nr:unnamed protein product [Callosobruchus chinensis]